jgi:ribosomal protein S18 acetylase RimI-like enzyme
LVQTPVAIPHEQGGEIGLIIRQISDADEAQVVDLWRLSGLARPWNDPAKDIAFARQSPQNILLVGVMGRRVVASAMVGEDGHRGWVYCVATHPELQHRGIARDMMNAAEAWLKARGIWRMQLLVREDNAAAKGFYEQLGYRDTKTVCLQKVIAGDPESGDAR